MIDTPFVDAHVHFWDPARLRYPWLTSPFADDGPNGSVEAIAGTFLPADYRALAARWNMIGAVHVEAGAHPADALAETKWLVDLAASDGLPSGIVAFVDLTDPQLDAVLAAHAAHVGVRGVRHILNWHTAPHRTYTVRDMAGDPAWQAGFARLARHGLSFDLQCYPGQMPGLAAVFARHPDIPVIVDHLGMPVPGDPDGLAQWRTGMAALAALPQVAVKLSGVGFVWRDWSEDAIRPLILAAIELFGADRCMFASDVPTDLLFGSMDRHMTAYHAIVADFTLAELNALFGRNANRIYRLGLEI